MFWDATYILVIIGAIISAIASWNVNQTYKKFSKFQNGRGLLAEDVAALLLHKAGIFDVRIEKVRGFLTDHYSPNEKVLRLSESVYGSTLLGLIMGWTGLTQIGVLLFTFVVLFQLITLPVEFNASSRALRVLEEHRLLIGGELKGATKVLQAAALTYVASLFSSILQLLRLILLTKRNDRRR